MLVNHIHLQVHHEELGLLKPEELSVKGLLNAIARTEQLQHRLQKLLNKKLDAGPIKENEGEVEQG
jgi:hypothetical protein